MTDDLKPSRDIAVLLDVMKRLREGCPWDKVQTFDTIAPYTIEEAYEVASAIAEKDFKALPGELGDLLFQVVFHARMAEERGLFDFGDVVAAVTGKMVRRHPHVFADRAGIDTAEAQVAAWEEHKAVERAGKPDASLLDDVPRALPALTRALKLQKRAASVGFDWDSAPRVVEKLAEEAHEIVEAKAAGASQAEIEEEIGDLLFVVANLARHLKVQPEDALRAANEKFSRRFRFIEQSLRTQGKSPHNATLDDMEALWQQAKALE
jgi:MazG family protein